MLKLRRNAIPLVVLTVTIMGLSVLIGCSDLIGPTSNKSEPASEPVHLIQRLPPMGKAAPPLPEPEPIL